MVIHPLGSAMPTRSPTRSPVAATLRAAGVGDCCRPSRPGLLRSPTSSELQAASVMTPRAAAAMRVVRDMAGILLSHSPRLMVKKKLRLGGYGVTSMFRAIGWLPKLLTSGSKPLYGVATQKRFRALTDSWAVRTPHSLLTVLAGSSQLTATSRTFTTAPFSMWVEVAPPAHAPIRASPAAPSGAFSLASWSRRVRLITLPPCCQSTSAWRETPFHVRSLVKDIRNSGLASPTTFWIGGWPATGLGVLPMIWVADFPFSILNTPRLTPNPPVRKGSTGSSVILLWFFEKVVRKSHCTSRVCFGVRAAATSTPRTRSAPPLKISWLNPFDGGRFRVSRRSLTFFW